jgi:hypothetical protein
LNFGNAVYANWANSNSDAFYFWRPFHGEFADNGVIVSQDNLVPYEKIGNALGVVLDIAADFVGLFLDLIFEFDLTEYLGRMLPVQGVTGFYNPIAVSL